MMSSLTTAQKELEAIETNIGLVGDPKRYKEINTSHVQPKVRDSSDLPLDSARIAFRSHNARLVNYDKSKSDNLEKAIIQQRQKNTRIAEKEYIGLQYKALGIDPPKPKPRIVNAEQLQKAAELLRANAIEKGQNPAAIDAALKIIMKSGNTKEATPRTPKGLTKRKEEPEIER